MFNQNFGINQYAQVGIETGVAAANPVKLVVMLYEGAIAASNAAIFHMKQKDIAQKSAMISKVIMILESGLRLSLDKKAGGEIAQSLDALYAYMSDRLYIANIRNQPEAIEEVIHLLKDLKTAWESISHLPISESKPTMKVPTRLAHEYAKV